MLYRTTALSGDSHKEVLWTAQQMADGELHPFDTEHYLAVLVKIYTHHPETHLRGWFLVL